LPTAVQSLADGHETPVSPELPGLRRCWTTHLIPFHRSASGLFDLVVPTAVQAVGDEQDTASSQPTRPVPDLWMRQRCPSQRSTIVPSSVDPTAKQSFARGHDTPINAESTCGTFGVA
jgi:hypothetical protein